MTTYIGSCADQYRFIALTVGLRGAAGRGGGFFGGGRCCPLWGRGRARTEDVSSVKVKGVQGVVSDIFVSL